MKVMEWMGQSLVCVSDLEPKAVADCTDFVEGYSDARFGRSKGMNYNPGDWIQVLKEKRQRSC